MVLEYRGRGDVDGRRSKEIGGGVSECWLGAESGAGIGNARALSVALPDKRQVGVRFSYAFGGGK